MGILKTTKKFDTVGQIKGNGSFTNILLESWVFILPKKRPVNFICNFSYQDADLVNGDKFPSLISVFSKGDEKKLEKRHQACFRRSTTLIKSH